MEMPQHFQHNLRRLEDLNFVHVGMDQLSATRFAIFATKNSLHQKKHDLNTINQLTSSLLQELMLFHWHLSIRINHLEKALFKTWKVL